MRLEDFQKLQSSAVPASTAGSVENLQQYVQGADFAKLGPTANVVRPQEAEGESLQVSPWLAPTAGLAENIANQTTQLGAMALEPANAVGSILGELADALVNQRMPSIDSIAERMGTGHQLTAPLIYEPKTETGQAMQGRFNEALMSVPVAVDALDDLSGSKFKNNFPNIYAAAQSAGELLPFMFLAKGVHAGLGSKTANPLYRGELESAPLAESVGSEEAVKAEIQITPEVIAEAQSISELANNPVMSTTAEAAKIVERITQIEQVLANKPLTPETQLELGKLTKEKNRLQKKYGQISDEFGGESEPWSPAKEPMPVEQTVLKGMEDHFAAADVGDSTVYQSPSLLSEGNFVEDLLLGTNIKNKVAILDRNDLGRGEALPEHLQGLGERLDQTNNYGLVKQVETPTGKHYVAVINTDAILADGPMGDMRKLEAVLHEAYGHIVVAEKYGKASADTKLSLAKDFARFAGLEEGEATAEFYPLKTGEIALGVPEGMDNQVKFKEWLTNGIVKWATSAAEPVGLANKWFASLAQAFKEAWAKVSGKSTQMPAESIREWMDSLFDSKRLGEALEDKVPTSDVEVHTPVKKVSIAKQLEKLKASVLAEELANYEVGHPELPSVDSRRARRQSLKAAKAEGKSSIVVYKKTKVMATDKSGKQFVKRIERTPIQIFKSTSRSTAQREANLFKYAHALASKGIVEASANPRSARFEYYRGLLQNVKESGALQRAAEAEGISQNQAWLNFLADPGQFIETQMVDGRLARMDEAEGRLFRRFSNALEHDTTGVIKKAILVERSVRAPEITELIEAEPVLKAEMEGAKAPGEAEPSVAEKRKVIVRKKSEKAVAPVVEAKPVEPAIEEAKPVETIQNALEVSNQNSVSNFEKRVRDAAENNVEQLLRAGAKVNLERIQGAVEMALGLAGKELREAKKYIKENYEELKQGKAISTEEAKVEVEKQMSEMKISDDVSVEEAAAYLDLLGDMAVRRKARPENIFTSDKPGERWPKVLKESGIFKPTVIKRLWRADATHEYAPVNGAEFRAGQHEKFKPAGTYWARDKESLIPLITGGYYKTEIPGEAIKRKLVKATEHHLRTGENAFSVGRPLEETRAVSVMRDDLKAFMLQNPTLPASFNGEALRKALSDAGVDFLEIKGVSGNPELSEIIQLEPNSVNVRGRDIDFMAVRRKSKPITGPLYEKPIKMKKVNKLKTPEEIAEKTKQRLLKEKEFVEKTSQMEKAAEEQNVSLTEYLRATGMDEASIAKVLRKYIRLAKTVFTDTEHILRLGKELGLVNTETGVQNLEAFIKGVFPKAQGPLRQLTITGRDILMQRLQVEYLKRMGEKFDFGKVPTLNELRQLQREAQKSMSGWEKFKSGVAYFTGRSLDELQTTPAGAQLAHLIRNVITTESALYTRDYLKKLNDYAKVITDPQDREHVLNVYLGIEKARNKTFQEAADLLTTIYTYYAIEMERVGVRTLWRGGYQSVFKFDPADKYFPHMWEPNAFEKPSEKMLNSLTVSGMPVDAKQARAIIQQHGRRMRRLSAPRFSNLEMAREVDMDGWIKDPFVVTTRYVKSGANRLAILREVGQEPEVRLAQLAWDHYQQTKDPDSLNFAVKVINATTGVSVHERMMQKGLNMIGAAEFVAMAAALQHAALIQPSVVTNVATTAGWKNTVKGFYRYIKADPRKASMSREWADVLGASSRSIGMELMHELTDVNSLESRAGKLLSYWGVTKVDRWLRDASTLVGQLHVNDMLERAINLGDKKAERELNRLGLTSRDVKAALDAGQDFKVEEYIKKGSYQFSEMTNLMTDPLSSPTWQMDGHSGFGRLLTLFGRFAFHQHHFLKDTIKSDPKKLAKYLASAVAVGVPIYTMRQIAKGQNPVKGFEDGDYAGTAFAILQSGGGLGMFADMTGEALLYMAGESRHTGMDRLGGPMIGLVDETVKGTKQIMHGNLNNAQALKLLLRAGTVTLAGAAPQKWGVPAAAVVGASRPLVTNVLKEDSHK